MTLTPYVDAWAESAQSTIALLRDLPASAWQAPTGCPGWTVRDVVAHLAALESELAGTAPGVAGDARVDGSVLISDYTEAGVAARRDVEPADLVTELETAVAARANALAPPPDDPAAPARPTPGGVAWDNATLLRNRVIDVWMHEQDVRTAVGRPGGYGEAGALVVGGFLAAVPYVLAKKVQAERGTRLVLELTGPVARTVTAEIGDDGRGHLHEGDLGDATARVRMSAQTFVVLVGGREVLQPATVDWTGDSSLVGDLLAEIAVTP